MPLLLAKLLADYQNYSYLPWAFAECCLWLRKELAIERCCGLKLVFSGLQSLFAKSAWLNFGSTSMSVLGTGLDIRKAVRSFYIETAGDKHIKPALISSEILVLPFRIWAGCCASCMLPLLVCFSPENPTGCFVHGCVCTMSHCEPWAVSQGVLSLVMLVFQRAAMALCSEKSSSCWGLQTLSVRGLMKCVSLCACSG